MPRKQDKKYFWKRAYERLKKICKPVKNIDEAIRNGDPLPIASTLLDAGSELVGGDVGLAMRCARDVTYAISSDNPYDAIAYGIDASLRHADFGEIGNTFAQCTADGFHGTAALNRIEKKAFDHINRQTRDIIRENCRQSRQRYENYMKRFGYTDIDYKQQPLGLDKFLLSPGIENMNTQPFTKFNQEMSTSTLPPTEQNISADETHGNDTEDWSDFHTSQSLHKNNQKESALKPQQLAFKREAHTY